MFDAIMGNRIFPLCAVIRINGIFPKNIRISERKKEPDTQFLLLARSTDKFLFYLNLKSEISEGEMRKFSEFWTSEHSGTVLSINNNIVEMEVPDQLNNIMEKMVNVPLARVSPNVLRNGSDLYMSLEFCEYSSREVSNIVLEILDADFSNPRSLEYFGEYDRELPFLLNIYSESGLSLRNFTMVTTVWESGNEAISSVYDGFFLNDGNYVPKILSTGSNDILVIKPYNEEIVGNSSIKCHDKESKLAEVELKSGYLSDLLREIIKTYSGPLFYAGKTEGGKSFRYYILDTDLTPVFLKALSRFWNMDERKNYINYIYRIENLEDSLKNK